MGLSLFVSVPLLVFLSAVLSANAWPTHPTIQAVLVSSSLSEVSSWAESAIKNQQWITSIQYVEEDASFMVVASTFLPASSPYSLQHIAVSAEFPLEIIQKGWEDGLRLTSIAQGPAAWVVILSQPSEASDVASWGSQQLNYTENASMTWVQGLVVDSSRMVEVAAAFSDSMVLVTTQKPSGVSGNFVRVDTSMAVLLSSKSASDIIWHAVSTPQVALIAGMYTAAFGPSTSQLISTVDSDQASHSLVATPSDSNPVSSEVAGIIHQYLPKWYSRVSGSGFWATSFISGSQAVGVIMSQNTSMPASFDDRTAWPDAQSDVLNQGQCGSCFIFSTVESLATRSVISRAAPGPLTISPEPLVACAHIGGCNGGYLKDVWSELTVNGSTDCDAACSSGCAPYVSGNCSEGHDTQGNGCTQCLGQVCRSSNLPWDHTYHASSHYSVDMNELHIMAELATNGPAPTCFDLYANFYSFFDAKPNGVYNATLGAYLGGHCVTVSGWGTDQQSGLPYWLVRNSWGKAWGVDGYFKYIRGKNLGYFDQYITPGVVGDIEYPRKPKLVRTRTPADLWDSKSTPNQQRSFESEGAVGGRWVAVPCEATLGMVDIVSKPIASRVQEMLLFVHENKDRLALCETQVVAGLNLRFTFHDQPQTLIHLSTELMAQTLFKTA
eukprot:m.65459 g.65459  ORF g.65459 m.65459 type:complete len:666 (+) comp13541_c5_seq1:90-2087(+)